MKQRVKKLEVEKKRKGDVPGSQRQQQAWYLLCPVIFFTKTSRLAKNTLKQKGTHRCNFFSWHMHIHSYIHAYTYCFRRGNREKNKKLKKRGQIEGCECRRKMFDRQNHCGSIHSLRGSYLESSRLWKAQGCHSDATMGGDWSKWLLKIV